MVEAIDSNQATLNQSDNFGCLRHGATELVPGGVISVIRFRR
jgi:hypothetical protein